MAPEPGNSESSIGAFMSLGKPVELPGSQMQKIPTPEFKTNVPDIKNLLGDVEAAKQSREKEFRARLSPQERRATVEVLNLATEKHQLIDAERTAMQIFEDMSLHKDGTSSEYVLDDVISTVAERRMAMEYNFATLAGMRYIDESTYDPETTEARFAFPGYSYTTVNEIRPVQSGYSTDPEGNIIQYNVDNVPTPIFLVGTDDERKKLSGDLKEVQAEMTARKDLVQMLRYVWDQTENLDGLVLFYLKGSMTNEAMQYLCNSEGRKFVSDVKEKKSTEKPDWGKLLLSDLETPSTEEEKGSWLKKTEGGAEYREGHEFGDATSVALQCFEIAAVSESPDKLKDLLKRPGARFLFKVTDQEIDDIFLKPTERANRTLNNDLVKWIGEPWQWSREIKGIKENLGNEQKSRGLLTNKGNVLAASDWDSIEHLSQQVERFIGGGDNAPILLKKDARDARFIAWGLLRTTGMASDLGGQRYKQECVDGVVREVVSHDLGGMTSCDRVKVIAPNVFRNVYRYIKPEVRNYGPDGSLDKYPDRFTVQYFKTWNADIKWEVDEKGDPKEGSKWIKDKMSHGKRTYQEMRRGYRAGKETDLLTGKEVDLPAEEAYRLGELPWGLLGGKAYNAAALGPYIAGREKVGLFVYMKRQDWDIRELKDEATAKNIANFLGIAINAQTVFDGKYRGIYNGNKDHDGKVSPVVKSEIRDYKKKFFYAWWDGLRSLPQYREWCAMPPDQVKNADKGGGSTSTDPIKRIKYHLGKVQILTPEEAMNLSDQALNTERFA